LQAQCILFRRYPEVLQPFKYAGYPMLLQALSEAAADEAAAPEAHFLSAEKAPLLQVLRPC
jgi:DnaJ homolog subfamily C member 13